VHGILIQVPFPNPSPVIVTSRSYS